MKTFEEWRKIREAVNPTEAIEAAIKDWDIERQKWHRHDSISQTGREAEFEDKYYDGQTGQIIKPLPQNLQKAANALVEMIAQIRADQSYPKKYHNIMTPRLDVQGQPVLSKRGRPQWDHKRVDAPSPHQGWDYVKNSDGTKTGPTQTDTGLDHVIDTITNNFGLDQEGENLMFYIAKKLNFGDRDEERKDAFRSLRARAGY